MMEQLSGQVRVFVYVVICFQCILQLTEGSTYQRYLKLISYLLVIYIVCHIGMTFAGKIQEDWAQADVLCEEWLDECQKGDSLRPEKFKQYTDMLEQRMQRDVQQEYDRREEDDARDVAQTDGEMQKLYEQSEKR